MSVASAVYASTVNAVEVLDIPLGPAAAANSQLTVPSTAFSTAKTLNPTSTPPVSAVTLFEQPLSAGAAVIDLTALVGTGGGAVDLTGLKVQVFKVKNKDGNADPITVTPGGSNPYLLAGSGFSVTLAPGQEFTFYGAGATAAVGASQKAIGLTGVGSQVAEVTIFAG